MEYKIDATNKILGRLATEIAVLLRGKNSPSFAPNRLSENRVIVMHADKIAVSGRKRTEKHYYRHSGYVGRLKKEKFADVAARDPGFVIRNAVLGMLPKNKTRKRYIRNLVIHHNGG